ncbi:MAG TPA: LamG-like jellyroll fold domain-containing protein, partial [Pyrinomonadaceae bacterium]|nr:LamG-like jellyroll fold domain-containing protein [Pyrinomonadaceae bacterium]
MSKRLLFRFKVRLSAHVCLLLACLFILGLLLFRIPGTQARIKPIRFASAGPVDLIRQADAAANFAQNWNRQLEIIAPDEHSPSGAFRKIDQNTKLLGPDLIYPYLINNSATLSIAAQASACVSPPADMVSWYPADGSSNDLIGTNSNGALQNGVGFTAGKVSQAFSFDGADDLVILPVAVLKTAFTALTIDAWLFPLSHGKDTAYGLFGRTVISNTEGDGFALRVVDGYLQADLRVSTSGNLLHTFSSTPQARLPLNQWSHVALSYSGTQVSAYLNGQLVGSVAASGAIRSTYNASTCAMIGTEPAGCSLQGGGFGWHGQIDELEVFGRALTQAEIRTIYEAGAEGKCKTSSLQFSAASYSINENGGSATITVTRTSNIGSATISYAASNGTATAGLDFTTTSG